MSETHRFEGRKELEPPSATQVCAWLIADAITDKPENKFQEEISLEEQLSILDNTKIDFSISENVENITLQQLHSPDMTNFCNTFFEQEQELKEIVDDKKSSKETEYHEIKVQIISLIGYISYANSKQTEIDSSRKSLMKIRSIAQFLYENNSWKMLKCIKNSLNTLIENEVSMEDILDGRVNAKNIEKYLRVFSENIQKGVNSFVKNTAFFLKRNISIKPNNEQKLSTLKAKKRILHQYTKTTPYMNHRISSAMQMCELFNKKNNEIHSNQIDIKINQLVSAINARLLQLARASGEEFDTWNGETDISTITDIKQSYDKILKKIKINYELRVGQEFEIPYSMELNDDIEIGFKHSDEIMKVEQITFIYKNYNIQYNITDQDVVLFISKINHEIAVTIADERDITSEVIGLVISDLNSLHRLLESMHNPIADTFLV